MLPQQLFAYYAKSSSAKNNILKIYLGYRSPCSLLVSVESYALLPILGHKNGFHMYGDQLHLVNLGIC